ncbi:MAG: c-type cytochrome [Myxococcota bacterium]
MRGVRARLGSTLLAAAVATAAWLGAPASLAEKSMLGEREARLFQQACAHCHLQPGLGAPVLGDDAAWEERRAQGVETLLANTVRGVRDMPPLGTCGGCTEDDLRRLVAFLAGLPPPTEEAAP